MTINPTADVCAPDCDCVVPYEFVRLRYFFGQRLGVLELNDEQSYVVNKQRFHNRHLHGAGVLCGLRAERYSRAGQTESTLLKVTSGAALDACGREIIVGWDACIDVAAWVRQHRADNPDLADPQQPSAQRVWVVVCYQECPGDPAPALRDSCSCEPAGCEYSRVREGFHLDLVTDSDLPKRIEVHSVSGTCPAPVENACLVLARVDLVLDAAGEVTDLGAIDHDIAHRQHLWSTAALQTALTGLIDASELAAALVDGPRMGRLAFSGSDASSGTLSVPIVPAQDETDTPSPILGDPVPHITFTVHRLLDDGNWQPGLSPTIGWDSAGSRFELVFTNELTEGRYRVSGSVSAATPIVDTAFRELLPRTINRWFRLSLDAGVLTLSELAD